jgi:glutathione peroxidase
MALGHDFTFNALDGDPIVLSDFTGRALLVVNTASHCGFTPQLTGLQRVWERFAGDGLMVIGVPSNDFGKQEPGGVDEIRTVCVDQFNITFPITEKTAVKGPNRHPFYAWAAQETGLLGRPRWNFHKYLIGRDGQLRDWFSTVTKPDSPKLARAIRQALDA